VDVTLIYLSQKSFRQFQVPRSRRRDVMTATSDPFGKRDFGGHWISLIHPTVMITPQKRWTCYILELTPSTLTSMHKYINAQIIAKKWIGPLHTGFGLSSTYFFPRPPKFPSRHLRLGAISDEEHEVVGPLRHIHVRLGSQGVKLRVLCRRGRLVDLSMKHGDSTMGKHGPWGVE